MSLIVTTNWGHKNKSYLQIRSNNNNVYIQLKYVACINGIIKQ